MEQAIGIVTDSNSDLPPGLVHELGIEIVPLSVHFGTEVYADGALSADEFWHKAATSGQPKTSQPSVGAFDQAYAHLVDSGKQVLCLTVTGKHSGTYGSAQLAAQRFEGNVTVLDSNSLSVGLGWQAVVAARAAKAGRSMQEIIAQLLELQAEMRLLIILDTLEYLRLGGRADSFIAVVDRMTRVLNIKIMVTLVDGEVRLLAAARSFKAALKRVLNLVEQAGPLAHLAVMHARNRVTAEQFAHQLAERTGFPAEQVWIREIGAVLSTHGGPGALGVLAVPLSAAG